jgi:hypothetical protein
VDRLKAQALQRIDLTFEGPPPVTQLRTVAAVRDLRVAGNIVHLDVEDPQRTSSRSWRRIECSRS